MDLSVIIVSLLGLILLLGFIIHLQVCTVLKKTVSHISNSYTSEEVHLKEPWMKKMFVDYRNMLENRHYSSQTIIDNHLLKKRIRLFGLFPVPIMSTIRLQQQLPSSSIMIGILGTFIGLTSALYEMQQTLLTFNANEASGLTMNTVISSVAAPFQGMSLAFVTSMAGIGCGLILSLLHHGFFSNGKTISYYQNQLYSECEFVLEHIIQKEWEAEKPTDSFERILDRLATRIQQSYHDTLGSFKEEVSSFNKHFSRAIEDLSTLIRTHREQTDGFLEGTKRLEQFGDTLQQVGSDFHSLKGELNERVHLLINHFDDLTRQLKHATERQENAQRGFDGLLQRSDKLMKETSNKTNEISKIFVSGLEEQMKRNLQYFEEFQRNMQQTGNDWYYRFQEKNDQYQHVTEDFAASVKQLENAWYDTVEKLKRDLADRREPVNRLNAGNDSNREMVRALNLFSDRLQSEFRDIQQYLNEFYQILNRLLEHQHARASNISEQAQGRPFPKRVTD